MSNVSWPNCAFGDLCVKAQHIIATKEGGEAHCGVNNESLDAPDHVRLVG
jgi:hypothetical protein